MGSHGKGGVPWLLWVARNAQVLELHLIISYTCSC